MFEWALKVDGKMLSGRLPQPYPNLNPNPRGVCWGGGGEGQSSGCNFPGTARAMALIMKKTTRLNRTHVCALQRHYKNMLAKRPTTNYSYSGYTKRDTLIYLNKIICSFIVPIHASGNILSSRHMLIVT